MLRILLSIAIFLILCGNVSGVSISISASNGESVLVSHHYSAEGDASYRASGEGSIKFESVEIEESFSYSGEVESGSAKVNHLIKGKDYAVVSVHDINCKGEISEKGNFAANENEGVVNKEIKDNAEGEYESFAESYIVTVKNVKTLEGVDDVFGERLPLFGTRNQILGYSLYWGSVEGKQFATTTSTSQELVFGRGSYGSFALSYGCDKNSVTRYESGAMVYIESGERPNTISKIEQSTSIGSTFVQQKVDVKDDKNSTHSHLELWSELVFNNRESYYSDNMFMVNNLGRLDVEGHTYTNSKNDLDAYMEGYLLHDAPIDSFTVDCWTYNGKSKYAVLPYANDIDFYLHAWVKDGNADAEANIK